MADDLGATNVVITDPVESKAAEPAAQAPSPTPPPPAAPPGTTPVRKIGKRIVVIALVCLAAAAGWSAFFSHQVSTDDAQVDGHITSVSPRISGYIDRLLVNDNQSVAAGELLARIDPRDYQAAVDQASAALQAAAAQAKSARIAVQLTRDTVSSTIESSIAAKTASESELLRSEHSLEQTSTATLKAAEAALEAKRAVSVRAQADLTRYRPLLQTKDVSQLQFDAVNATALVATSELALAEQKLAEARIAVDIAEAQASAAKAQLSRSRALVRQSEAQQQQIAERDGQYQSAVAAVDRAKAQLEIAKLQLSYTEIRAPIAGVVTQKTVQLGDHVSPGQLLLTLVPLDQVYVTANFKETQLEDVRPGQRAAIKADMYHKLEFEGTVDSISGAAGSRQALLPLQNATGNFVKVVQRIPVKILVKPSPRVGTVLRPGTNVKATVYVR
jgi:membrane fusion protein, multidrug efflux system